MVHLTLLASGRATVTKRWQLSNMDQSKLQIVRSVNYQLSINHRDPIVGALTT